MGLCKFVVKYDFLYVGYVFMCNVVCLFVDVVLYYILVWCE